MPGIKLKSSAMTPIGRAAASYTDLLRDAVTAATAGVDAGSIHCVYLSSFAPTELCGISDPAAAVRQVLAALDPAIDAPVVGPFRTGGEALYHALAFQEYAAGDVLVVGCEKMTHVDAGRAAGLLAPRVSDPIEQRHGATLPALAALASQAYARRYRVPYRAFHRVSVKNHRNAARNPLAHFRREVTEDEVAASPLVADPLRRHHCAPVSDGAAACVLSARDGDVRFRGHGRGLDTPCFHDRADIARFRAAALAAREAFASARAQHRDVTVVEIHDAFASFELMNLEEMGFYPSGEGWRALDRGDLEIGGRLAVNPSGGMKGRGHPIGVCGLSSLYEMHLQLTARAGDRQQAGARLGVIQSAGGVSADTYVFVVEAA